jgi:hypothetical protein
MSSFSSSAAMPLQGIAFPTPARATARPRARTGAAARPRAAARAKPASVPNQRVACCALLLVLVLEMALLFFPQALRLSPVQGTVLFKQISGYSMCTLLAFGLSLGWVRTLPGMARRVDSR